ncbi:hypothetical protein [Winogradskyella eckloniae]|uniref:hypothetical protein n=1 Tax=Winogradskyella eckloniae TaxID=1089306 RepID=UPI0015652CBD|nr:hypothetical protein [Winogradskyella eckloniae]
MKKSKKHKMSTDYFFEHIFKKSKHFLISNWPSKIAAIKVLAIVSWFKDIN